MNRAKELATLCSKSNRGPGGWRCPCCRYASKRWMKVHMNRAARRAARVRIKMEAA